MKGQSSEGTAVQALLKKVETGERSDYETPDFPWVSYEKPKMKGAKPGKKLKRKPGKAAKPKLGDLQIYVGRKGLASLTTGLGSRSVDLQKRRGVSNQELARKFLRGILDGDFGEVTSSETPDTISAQFTVGGAVVRYQGYSSPKRARASLRRARKWLEEIRTYQLQA